MISQNYFTFPFYIPRICRLFVNWPEYLVNYSLRRRKPAEYRMRNGGRLIDGTGTLAGTIAVVFVRREYGLMQQLETIVDIGANMGSFAVYAAQCCPKARIFCYEPEQRNVALLKQNINANALEGRVTAFQYAVASSDGQRDLKLGESPLNSLHIVAAENKRQKVHCTTVKKILDTHGLEKVDLLKINCEGAEYEILEGCTRQDFDKLPNIRLEYHNLDGAKRNGKSLATFLESRGYRIDRFTRYCGESGFIWATRIATSSLRPQGK